MGQIKPDFGKPDATSQTKITLKHDIRSVNVDILQSTPDEVIRAQQCASKTAKLGKKNDLSLSTYLERQVRATDERKWTKFGNIDMELPFLFVLKFSSASISLE